MKNYTVWLLLMIIGLIGIIAFAKSDDQKWGTRLNSGDWKSRVRAIKDFTKATDVNDETKIELFLSGLADEIQKPTSDKLIENGYISEEEYFRKQYLYALVNVGKNHLPKIKRDIKSINRNRFTNNLTQSTEWNQRVTLALVLLGEKKLLPDVRKILNQSKNGDIRTSAAHVIKTVKDKQAIPQLEVALNDPYSVTYSIHGNETVIFPVRAKAAGALMELGVLVNFNGNEYSVSSSPSQER